LAQKKRPGNATDGDPVEILEKRKRNNTSKNNMIMTSHLTLKNQGNI